MHLTRFRKSRMNGTVMIKAFFTMASLSLRIAIGQVQHTGAFIQTVSTLFHRLALMEVVSFRRLRKKV